MEQAAAKKSGRDFSEPDSLYGAGYIRPLPSCSISARRSAISNYRVESLSNSCAARLERVCHSIAISVHAAFMARGRIQRKLLTGQCFQPKSLRDMNHVNAPHIGGSITLSVTVNSQNGR